MTESFLGGKVVLHSGDCRDVMRALPDNSVDAIVTDPPYALVSIQKRFSSETAAAAQAEGMGGAYKRLSGGFMGKKWDTGEAAFAVEFWAEALRVLKPGGHVVAFGGTRTYHRLACAIEDGGFEIRDCLMWVYGCLDAETVAVTPNGLAHHSELNVGDIVLTYDPATKAYSWGPIEHVHRYSISDTVYRIATDYGDQVVSRNHRCIVERGGEETFQFAEEIAREREACVPVLEDLPALLAAVSGSYQGTGDAQSDMLPRVHESAHWPYQLWGAPSRDAQGQVESDVLSLRNRVLAEYEVVGQGEAAGMFAPVQRGSAWSRVEGTRAQGPCGVESGVGGGAGGALHRAVQSIMEGWRHVSAQARELCERALCSLPRRVLAYGTNRWLCDGASPCCGSYSWALSDTIGVGASHRPQTAQQRPGQPHVVRDEQGSQTVRGWEGHHAVVGRVTAEQYDGVIWCVTVRTGAFVAVRNGMAFPTGNSGFPKSHNVSKAIDKAAGAEREIVRIPASEVRNPKATGSGRDGMDGATRPWIEQAKERGFHEKAGDTPVTDAAKQWDGWGTALKPAVEPIVLARKPLDGTVAANVLKWGTGAINVDGCRVAHSEECRPIKAQSLEGRKGRIIAQAIRDKDTTELKASGRYPANIIHDGSAEVVGAFPESDGQQGDVRGTEPSQVTADIYGAFNGRVPQVSRGDSGSAARFFYTAKADSHDRIASKHPTVKPVDLMQWLVRLVCPKGGTVLDPFAGTGTTGEAAWREGVRAILIEREVDYQQDIARRMDLADKPSKRQAVAKTKGAIDDLGPLFASPSAVEAAE